MTDIRLTHVGGPTVLLEVGGWRLLTDPTFDAPGRRYSFGWGSASRKVSGPAVPPERIGPVDAVLLTHDQHADNLDDAGRALLPGAGTVLTTRAGAGRLGGNARGLLPWTGTRLSAPGRVPIDVMATPCRHGPPGGRALAGDVIGFALEWPGQRHGALWISGDTVFYPGVRAVADRVRVGTAVLHLGAVRFGVTGPVRYTMTAREGVELCTLLRPRTVVPMHYEGWGHFREARSAIDAAFAAGPPEVRDAVRWAPIGEPLTVAV